MLQLKLGMALALIVTLVVTLAGLLVWASRQVDYHLERQQRARDVLEHYLQLSNDAYRLFKQKIDALLIGADQDLEVSAEREALALTLAELRRLTVEEVALVGAKEPDEPRDLDQIDALERIIDQGLSNLEKIATLRSDQQQALARTELVRTLETFIDSDFARAIDRAIAEERREARAADAAAERITGLLGWSAALGGALATVVVVATGVWLARLIRTPLRRLLEGTEAIAAGDLGHRVRLERPEEFAKVALSFNRMAAEVEQHEALLQLARNQLEHKVRERTRQLEQANRTLRRLDEVRRRSFADIGHELRTPLTVIRGEAEVTLRNRRATAVEQRSALERIAELSGQLARLIEDLMLLARSDAETARLELGQVELDRLLQSVAEDARILAAEKGVEVTWTLPEEPVVVTGDVDRLRQLFLILIDNACRYTERGVIDLSLWIEDGEAQVVLADSGIGITEDERGSIFERFFRGRRAQELVPRGSGLGLHMARTIVEAHGGSIAIESVAGHGTTVRVRLPVSVVRDVADAYSAG